MIDLGRFKDGMKLLGTAFGRQITKGTLDVFGAVLSGRLTTEQWERAVQRVMESEKYFPPPAVLLRYGLAEGAPLAEAGEVYAAIVQAFETGTNPGPREVREQWGEAAMEAFVAAGGTRAFSWCEPESEPFRRRDFFAAWIETTEQEPQRALPSSTEQKRIDDGPTE